MIRHLMLLALTLTTASASFADRPALQWGGFVSQGYLHTDENGFFGASESGSWAFRELGLHGSWAVGPRLQLAGQVISRRAGNIDDGSPRMDFAVIDYRLVSDADTQAGVRLGRLKNPLGFYNDTRDVPFTRPGALLPQSIYFDRTRRFALSSDGAGVYASHSGLELELVVGNPLGVDGELEQVVFGTDLPGEYAAETSIASRLSYTTPDQRWRTALSYARAELDFVPGPGLPASFPFREFHFRPVVLSLQYSAERLTLTGEYAWRRGAVGDRWTNGESYYLQAGYRLNDALSTYLRHDAQFGDRNDRNGQAFAASDRARRAAHTRFARDWTLGMNWTPARNWLLQAELHRIDGTGWLPLVDNPDPAAVARRWNLATLLLSYRF